VSQKKPSISPSVSLGLGLFLLAFLVRVPGLAWGLPGPNRIGSLHPDEPINWMVTQRVSLTNLDTGFYNYGSLFFFVQKFFASLVPASGDVISSMRADLLLGRGVNALFGAGIVWLVFAFLFKRTHLVGALFGAGLVCFAPGLVVHSRFYSPDILSTFLIFLALYLASELEGKSDWKSYAYVGLVAGLAMGTKYTGFLATLAVTPFLMQVEKAQRFRLALAVIGSTIVGFLISTPGVFLNPKAFADGFGYEVWHSKAGHGLVFAGTSPAILYHLGNLAATVGFVSVLIGFVGLGRASYRKHRWALALVLFAVAYYLVLGTAEIKFARYVFPLIPVLAVGFGWIIGRMHENEDKKWKIGVAIAAFSLAGFFGGGISSSAIATNQMVNPDPRDVAAEFLVTNGKGRSVGLVSDPWFYSPTLYPLAQAPRSVGFVAREEARLNSSDPKVLRYVPEDPNARQDWDLRLLTDLKPDYVIFSSFEAEGYLRLANQKSDSPEVKNYLDFLKLLSNDYGIVKVFGPNTEEVHDMMYTRPYLQLWQRKAN
jgi:hypothetical protein